MSSSSDEQEQFDVIVVGARCAGSATATVLARAGRRVLLLDRDEFPSDTVSTHQLFPDSLHLLDELGAGELLRARHELRPVEYSWRVLGHAVAGGFSPVGGHDRTMSIRRVTLDAALLEGATKAGAEARLGAAVEDVIGAGTPEDPVRGVVLATGERVLAPWVIGADGRRSTVARRLALPTSDRRRGEMAMLFAYWEGLPPSGWCHIDVHGRLGVMSTPCEDGLHLLSVAGPPELTRGSAMPSRTAGTSAPPWRAETGSTATTSGARNAPPGTSSGPSRPPGSPARMPPRSTRVWQRTPSQDGSSSTRSRNGTSRQRC